MALFLGSPLGAEGGCKGVGERRQRQSTEVHEFQAQETGSWSVGHAEPQKSPCVIAARNHSPQHVPPWRSASALRGLVLCPQSAWVGGSGGGRREHA